MEQELWKLKGSIIYRILHFINEKNNMKKILEWLKSQTGRHGSKNNHKGIHLRKLRNKIEELELEIMKKDI